MLHHRHCDDWPRLHVICKCCQRLIVDLQSMPHIMATLAPSCSCNEYTFTGYHERKQQPIFTGASMGACEGADLLCHPVVHKRCEGCRICV